MGRVDRSSGKSAARLSIRGVRDRSRLARLPKGFDLVRVQRPVVGSKIVDPAFREDVRVGADSHRIGRYRRQGAVRLAAEYAVDAEAQDGLRADDYELTPP